MKPDDRPQPRVPGDPDEFSGHPEVHSITDAAAPHSEDIRDRMIKYAVAMSIRMVCIILIFVVDGWFKILAVAGAVFLPWIAVVIANGSDMAEVHSDALLDHVPAAELEGSASDDAADPAPMTVLQGELVPDEPVPDDADPDVQHDHRRNGEERAAS